MNKIKQLRKENDITQEELSKKTGIPYRTLQRWENNLTDIKSEKAQVLADFFGVSVAYLLGYSENRYGPEQIEKAIKAKLAEFKDSLDENILADTLKIIEQATFLDMDLDTLVGIYFYNCERGSSLKVLSDLFVFFDSEYRDYSEILSLVEPHQADTIIKAISKLGEYSERLTQYLNQIEADTATIPSEQDKEAKDRIDETYLKFINDTEQLKTLKSDTLVAIRFIENIRTNLTHGIVKPYSYAWEMEKISSELLDLLEIIEQRENELTD